MDKEQLFREICEKMANIYSLKNNDYGDSCRKTYDKLGAISFAVMLEHKLNRYESLAYFNVNQKVNDESVEDTLLDMASYCIQAIMCLRDDKKKEVSEALQKREKKI